MRETRINVNRTKRQEHEMNVEPQVSRLGIRCLSKIGLGMLLGALLALPSPAQNGTGPFANEEINLGRGFAVDTSVLALGQLDQVNLLNGNLTVTLPIGPTYPVGGGLSYRLALIYNSSIWDNRIRPCVGRVPACPQDKLVEAWPQLDSNAGVGWKLTLGGELYPPLPSNVEDELAVNKLDGWVFVGPDGGRHAFYQRLHGEVDDADGRLLYTNDGSYLRLKVVDTAPGERRARVVELPDGTVYRFGAFDQISGQTVPPDAELRDWRLTEIANQYTDVNGFRNRVTIDYPLDMSGAGWVVTIRDSRKREHRLHFDREPAGLALMEPPDLSRDRGRLRWAELATFGSPLSPTVSSDPPVGSPNAWVFEYDESFTMTRGDDHPDTPPTFSAPLLTAVQPPAGRSFSFRYWGQDGTSNQAKLSGRLRQMMLPTGGKVAWEYSDVSFPANQQCRSPGGDPIAPVDGIPKWVSSVVGVSRRTETDPTPEASVALAVWSYTREGLLTFVPCFGDDTTFKLPLVTEGRVIVEDPLGNHTVSFFSLFNQDPTGDPDVEGGDYPTTEGWRRVEYGLPFTRSTSFDPAYAQAGVLSNPMAGEGVFLSELRYAGAIDPDNLAESVWVAYQQDPFVDFSALPAQNDSQPPTADRNRRVVKRVIRFEKGSLDAGTMRVEESTDFDGFGHHRTEIVRGVGYPGTEQRTTITRYNPGDTYVPSESGPVDGNGPWVTTMTLPGFSANWLVNLFDLTRVEDSTGASVTRLCRNAATGFVEKERRLENPTILRGVDVLTVRSADADGNVVQELVYGGDLQNPTTSGFCGAPPAGKAAVRRTEHTYRAGALESSTLVDDRDETDVLVSANNVIDDSSGLPAQSIDASGVVTTFDYDPLGRVTSQVTAGDAPTVVTYSDFDPVKALPAAITIESQEPGTQTTLTKAAVQADGFGRIALEQIERPGMTGSNAATRRARYDALGRVLSVTVSTKGAPPGTAGKTVFSRDYRGRPVTVTRPDGTQRTFEYLGDRRVSTTVRIDGRNSTRRAFLDVFGRSERIHESSGPAGELVETIYEYDQQGRLTRVRAPGLAHDGTSVTQVREFEYDGLGFLRCESHPELGAAGTPCAANLSAGTIRYESYDATGNPGRVITSGSRTLETDYDAAGRAVRVWSVPVSGSKQLLQELYYGRDDGGANKSRGKLVLAKRHNPVGGGFATVTQTFDYLDPAGRLSDASLRSTTGRRFLTSYTYDVLGNVKKIFYPECRSPDCAGSPSQGADFVYDRGALTNVREVTSNGTLVGHVSNVTYHPSGLVERVAHPIVGGTLFEISEADASAMPRSGRIHFESSITSSDLLSLGNPTWDAAGNLVALGLNSYDYDLSGRLTRGTAGAGSLIQTATYDSFGNVKLDTPAKGTTGQSVDSQTNRLIGPGYDAFGNVIGGIDPEGFFGLTLTYDPLDRPVGLIGTGLNRSMLYDPEGNRVATIDHLAGTELWTLRGASAKVLREYEVSGGATSPVATWSKDYFHRGGLLAGSRSAADGRRHYFLDHLGSTRLVTDRNGAEVARYEYYPFGQMAVETPAPVRESRLLFTGHERDTNAAGDNDDLDYMLARNYSSAAGRFLGMDSVLGQVGKPQGWNRFTYAENNPLNRVDLDGRTALLADRHCVSDGSGGCTGVALTFVETEEVVVRPADPVSEGAARAMDKLRSGVPKLAEVMVLGMVLPPIPAAGTKGPRAAAQMSVALVGRVELVRELTEDLGIPGNPPVSLPQRAVTVGLAAGGGAISEMGVAAAITVEALSPTVQAITDPLLDDFGDVENGFNQPTTSDSCTASQFVCASPPE